jgi:ketosteroid isomerase-like protein
MGKIRPMSELNLSTPQAAEAAFYAAFAECDFKAMETVWAVEGVICIHPGSSVLHGRDAVMRSWANMLLNAEQPKIRVNVLSRTSSNGLAVHVVEEHITSGYGDTASVSLVLATNVYRDEGDGWRLLEHHASVPRFQRTGMNAAPQKHTLQ